jgi:hypothetical protein
MSAIRIFLTPVLLLACAAGASAQADAQPAAPAPAVTIAPTAKGLRVVAVGSVKQIRLEVFGEGGDTLYSSGFQAGNVRDWGMADRQGQPVPDGSYLCVVTFRDVSGRVGMRQGRVVVRAGRPSFQLDDGERVGAAEPEKALGAVTSDPADAMTLTAHDGAEGQVVSTRGGLSFRGGDFFAGKDKELMRLTSEGNLGVGTDRPEDALDVAGTIRARGGIRFDDGTVLTSARQLKGGGTPSGAPFAAADTAPAPSVSGTGTVNRMTKWSDAAGTLTDSVVTESGGKVGIGTASPAQPLHVRGKALFQNTGAASLFIIDRTDGKIAAFGGGGTSATLAYDDTGIFKIESNTRANIAQGVFGTGATTRFAVDGAGNVAIGAAAPTPGVKLDVAGNIRVTGNAVVDGNIAAKYQDVAEWVPARQQMAAGTVVILDTTRANAVRAATRAYDTHVAGVVTAQPGLILGEAGEDKVMVATTGRVKVRVDATRRPIRVGDLLVTSGKSGTAMRSLPVRVGGARLHRPGTIIGKALEPLAKGQGEILVLLSLQ